MNSGLSVMRFFGILASLTLFVVVLSVFLAASVRGKTMVKSIDSKSMEIPLDNCCCRRTLIVRISVYRCGLPWTSCLAWPARVFQRDQLGRIRRLHGRLVFRDSKGPGVAVRSTYSLCFRYAHRCRFMRISITLFRILLAMAPNQPLAVVISCFDL